MKALVLALAVVVAASALSARRLNGDTMPPRFTSVGGSNKAGFSSPHGARVLVEQRPQTLRQLLSDAGANFLFNVEDYGAKGDNSSDNTAAFNAAIGAAAANGGGVVLCVAMSCLL